jgi:GNAT superfamily N-acetyltransferase
MPYKVFGLGYAWWRGDPCPTLPQLAGFSVAPTNDYPLLADLARLELATILERVQQGNQPYVGHLLNTPVAYGWSAGKKVIVESFGLVYPLPATDRYLWDFVTLSPWRGQGIYPRFLQAILDHETDARRFWIGHDAGNQASERGILKAGFQLILRLVVTPKGDFKIVPTGPRERVLASPFGQHFGLIQVDDSESKEG